MREAIPRTTSHTVTGLTNDNAYWFHIRAFNITDGNQHLGKTSVLQVVTPRAVPGPPRNVAAAPGDGSVTLTWDPPASSGGIEITGYEFELDGSGRGWETIPGAGAARSHTVTDLTNGQAYTLRVRARNASGPGAAGAEVSVTPVAPPQVLMVNFQSSTYHVREGQGITVTVTLSPAADRTLGVPVTVTVGTAEAGDWDVSGLTNGGLGFADGDEFKRFTVSANQDGDEDGETVTLAFGSLPENVSAGANPSATVTITDDDGANKQPVAENDSAATEEDTPVAVDVLANDSDPNGDALIITQSSESTAGGSTEIESGKITYTPKADFHGEDSFSYTVSDQSGAENETATATVSLTVTPLNDPPEPVGAIPRQQLGVGGAVAEIDVAAYFRDRDGDVLTYTAVSSNPEIAQVAVAASTVTITPVGAGAATITVTAHDRPMDDPERLTAQQTISMRLVAASVVMRINRVNQTVLPEVLRAMSASGLGAVTGRIEQAVSGALPAGGFNLAGQSSLYQALQANARAIEDGTLDLERALADLSFVMPLNAAETGGRGAPGSLTLWGTGDYRNVSGGKDGAVEWNGEVLSVHLGSDARLREDLVAGLLVSWSRSAFDYTDHTDPEGISGTQESRLTSLNPYVGWQTPIGMSLWGTLGVGWGKVEIDDEEADPVSSGMTRRLAAAGASGRVFSSTDLIAGGTTRLTLRGQGSFARLEVEGAGLIEPLTVDVNRVRVALEGSHARTLAAGGTFTPAVELGLRHDGGGGETGGGVEFGGSLRYHNPASGLTMAARGWTLIVHGGDYEEWGISGLLRLDPGAASRGISLSMVPAWGETQSSLQRRWENSSTRMADGGAGATTMLPARLEANLGYGFGVLASRGVLTPYSGVSLAGNGSRRFSLGSRLEIGSSLNLSLEGARHSTAAKGELDYGLTLRGQVRF